MTDDRKEDQMDQMIRQAAQAYHQPPATPREEMWHAIREARQAPVVRPIHRPIRWLAWSAAAAAVLAVGVGIGLMIRPATGPEDPVVSVAAVDDAAGETVSMALATVAAEHLAQSEIFLALFRDAVRSGTSSGGASTTARHLLTNNRLIADSPVAADPALRELLQDLELVLAQISQLSDDSWEGETGLITDGLEQRALMTRLQTVVDAGTPRVPFSL